MNYPLSDYPVLARLVVGRIKVTRLDGRAWLLALYAGTTAGSACDGR